MGGAGRGLGRVHSRLAVRGDDPEQLREPCAHLCRARRCPLATARHFGRGQTGDHEGSPDTYRSRQSRESRPLDQAGRKGFDRSRNAGGGRRSGQEGHGQEYRRQSVRTRGDDRQVRSDRRGKCRAGAGCRPEADRHLPRPEHRRQPRSGRRYAGLPRRTARPAQEGARGCRTASSRFRSALSRIDRRHRHGFRQARKHADRNARGRCRYRRCAKRARGDPGPVGEYSPHARGAGRERRRARGIDARHSLRSPRCARAA